MTPRQRQCLDAISAYWAKYGGSPSFDDLRIALGAKSRSSVTPLIRALEGRGYIERIPNLARSIRVIEPPLYLPGAAAQDVPPAPENLPWDQQ